MKALRLSAATLLLLGSAVPSFGLTLGPAQGAAWIGQPLNLVFPLALDGREAGGNLCLEADVRQGDVRIDDKRFTLTLDPGPSPNTPRVHLRTTHAIVEPVVLVRLSAGCEFKSTRQYTLLADLPMTPAVVAPPVRASAPVDRSTARGASGESGMGSDSSDLGGAPATVQRPPARRSTSSAPARTPTERDAAQTRQRASAVPPVRRAPPEARATTPKPPAQRAATPQVTPKPSAPQQAAVTPPPPPAEEGKSRLLIEPLAPTTPGAAATTRQPAPSTAAAPPVLPLPAPAPSAAPSTAAPAGPASGAAGRVDPNAVAPTAPATGPVAAAPTVPLLPDPTAQERDSARFKAMDDALASLRAQSEQTQKLMLEMRSELVEARSSRYQNWLVYSLLAILAAMLLLLLFMWRSMRQTQQAAWWREGQGQVESEDDEEEAAPPRRSFARSIRGRLPRHGELPDEDDDEDDDKEDKHSARVDLEDIDDAQVLEEGQRRGMLGGPGFERAQIRSVNTEELFDVQQQADFFMSLGKHEQAIGVLRDHLSANPGTSALAYLDLLSILHSLGRRDDYARQAAAFEQRFNVDVPPFESFSRQGRGLEHYQPVLSRIAAVWPGEGTLDLIEELLFRQPGASDEVFDLTAYQELLLLHGVARDAAEHPFVQPATAPAELSRESRDSSRESEAETLYGGPDADTEVDGMEQTMPMPYMPESVRHATPLIMPAVDMDMAELDRTAFQTLRAPVENLPKPSPTPSADPHVIDFNPFDPENEEELKPGRFTIKR